MSYSKVKSICIKNGSVWMNSKCNNDTEPYELYVNQYFTNILKEKGEKEVIKEILLSYKDGNLQPASIANANDFSRAVQRAQQIEEIKKFEMDWSLKYGTPEYTANWDATRSDECKEFLYRIYLQGETKGKFIAHKKSFDGEMYLEKCTQRGAKLSQFKESAKIFKCYSDAKKVVSNFQSEYTITQLNQIKCKPKK
jgi:hypothetical protein